jgi:hypothetical protein
MSRTSSNQWCLYIVERMGTEGDLGYGKGQILIMEDKKEMVAIARCNFGCLAPRLGRVTQDDLAIESRVDARVEGEVRYQDQEQT